MVFLKKEERLATGISGFDKLIQGGFISDSLNLVLGNSGAGKTTFLLQFLYNGVVKHKEKGLYVSFESDESYIFRTGKVLGMNFNKFEKDGSCSIIKVDPEETIGNLQDKLMRIIIENDVRRVCIDPLNVFSLNLPKEISARKQLYDFLSFLRGLNVCVLVAGESDRESEGDSVVSEDIGFVKYLVDGVIELFSSGISGEGDRALRITKMRMTDHFRGPVGFELTKKGLDVKKPGFSSDNFSLDEISSKNKKKGK